MKEQEIKEKLEELVDGCSVNLILGYLSDIAAAKAAHIRENWSAEKDPPLAKRWDRASKKLQATSQTLDIINVS